MARRTRTLMDEISKNADRIALASLLLAMATVFVSGAGRGAFYHDNQNGITRNHLTVAANLSPEHGFLGFYHRFLDEDGEIAYRVYNRFPLGGHLLIKAAIATFPDDPAARVRAARTLVLVLFAAAAVAAFASLHRLTSSAGIALTATLLAFSSFFPLCYGSMVAVDGSIDLFAVLLTFHGMVVFAQEGRFGQLLAKTCGALLLGWHVYGLLLPFIVLGLAAKWWRGRGSGRPWAVRLVRSRHLALGVVALSFGLSVLAFNFAREHDALTEPPRGSHARSDEVTLADLPSFRSMVRRLGWDAYFNETRPGIAWRPLLGQLLQRAGRASVPYYAEHVVGHPPRTAEFAWWGIVVVLACAAGLTCARHWVPMAALAASGFCWGVLARGSIHYFEGMFLVGLPLVFFSVVLLQVRRLSERSIGVCAGAAVLVFVLSGLQMERLWTDAESGFRAEVADYERIRAIAPEGGVIVSTVLGIERARFFLPRRIFVESWNGRQRHRADFVLTRERVPVGAGLLTPDNRRMFLHDRAAYDARYATLGEPVLEGGRGWRVHLVGSQLLYITGEACGAEGRFRNEPLFFLAVFDDRGHERGRTSFRFHNKMFEFAGRCMSEISIPGYDVASRIRTGQFVRGEGPLWSEEVPLPDGARASS